MLYLGNIYLILTVFEFGVSNGRFEDDTTIGIAKLVKMNNFSFELITLSNNDVDISKENCSEALYKATC